MSNQARDRSCSSSRQPKSLESLYITVQNACSGLQNTLDGICKQCDNLQFESENKHAAEVLERLDVFESEVQLAMLSDAQCQLLAEDLDLNLNESTVIDVIKKLRDFQLLRKNVSTFFKTLNKRFSSILDNGVYLYCVSLIEITHEEVHEVIEYDEFISNQKLEISQAVEEIHHLEERWGNLTLDLHSTVDNLNGLQACLTDVQARWRAIKEKIFAWLKQDRDYPSRLTGRINSNKESAQCLLLEMDVIDESEKRRAEECRYRQDQIKSLQKKRREFYNNLGHIQRAKRYNASKMVVNELESAQETDGDKNSDPKKDSGGSKSLSEFHRRRDVRLDKEQSDVKASIADVDKRINELKKMTEEEEGKKSASLRRINEIQIEIAVMEKTSVDCREILLQRGKVQTFIQLRKGTLAKPTKGEISFEETCRFVARRVRHEWPRLYLHLPMWPIRNHDQRLEDINGLLGYQRMNVVLPRNRTPVEDAAAALAKWRLLSRRYINVEGLVTGLRQAKWLKLANEVRKRFVQEFPQEEEELSEKCGQNIVTESETVVIVESETSECTNSHLNKAATYEEASKETGEATSSRFEEKEEKEEEEKEVGEDNGIRENKEESLDSEEGIEANEDNKTECDKSEGMSDNDEHQECATDDEDNHNKSSNESIRTSSVDEEEGEKKHDNVEEIQDVELAETDEESKGLTDINNLTKSEKEDDSSAKSSRKGSMSSNGLKEQDKSKTKSSKYDISNSLDKNTSEEEISKNDNLLDQGARRENKDEYVSETSEIEREETNTSRKSSAKLTSKAESVSLGSLKKSPENSPKKLVKDEDGNKIPDGKGDENIKRNPKSENSDSASKEGDDSKNNSSSSESEKLDMVAEQTSANSEKETPKNRSNESVKKEISGKAGVKGKNTMDNEESTSTSKKAENKMPKSETDKIRPKPKGTILKPAESKSKTRSNENAKKEEKPRLNTTSKSEHEAKNEEYDAIDKKKDDENKNLQKKDYKEEIENKDMSEDTESKFSEGIHMSEEIGSGERKNEDKMTDREIQELNNNEEKGDQNIVNTNDTYKNVKEMQEPRSNNKGKESRSKEKETEKPSSKVNSTDKSTDKRKDKKTARKSKADESGKTKDKKKK
ncbi:unnamed protein product [Hymenolepis diminuta]|uniref:Death domain-containing protein n=1 Tax=Hymenolepis diminuta TaxID=6216 RepID=A0A564YGV4_HYMDI|nr:unnamed protein product [Hymenolepis diminuta]